MLEIKNKPTQWLSPQTRVPAATLAGVTPPREDPDGHGFYSSDPDVALLQFRADEDRAQCERDGVGYNEIIVLGYGRAIRVDRLEP